MLFRDIIGQEAVKQRLRESVRENRVPHALLLSGQAGVGKLQLALAYAQYLACPHRTADDACGECPTCKRYAALAHPDLHFVFPITTAEGLDKPVCDDFAAHFRDMVLNQHYFDLDDWHQKLSEEYKKVETKQLTIYERESSEILRKLSLMSFDSGYKTMVIWLPERMNETCANKLLKILEEPPAETLFLLVSNEPQRLLPTILSRTQQMTVPRLTEQEIAGALHEGKGTVNGASWPVEAALDYAHMANGSFLQARKTAANDATNELYMKLFQRIMRRAWSVGHRQDYDALIDMRDWAAEISKMGRDERSAFLDYCMKQVRENYITNYGRSEMVYQTGAERQFSERFAPFINDRNAEPLLHQLSLAQRQVEQNGNANIIFFDLALQLIVLIK